MLWVEEGGTCLVGAGWYLVCKSKTARSPDRRA